MSWPKHEVQNGYSVIQREGERNLGGCGAQEEGQGVLPNPPTSIVH